VSHLDELLNHAATRIPPGDMSTNLVAHATEELAAFRSAIATARGWLLTSVNANKMVLTKFTQECDAQKRSLEWMDNLVSMFDADMIELLGAQYRDALVKKP
jgi:hypothetical protein